VSYPTPSLVVTGNIPDWNQYKGRGCQLPVSQIGDRENLQKYNIDKPIQSVEVKHPNINGSYRPDLNCE
jgi:hypothetical protein